MSNLPREFRTAELRSYLGFDCSALPPSAHGLEQTLEFESAARAEFARIFDPWPRDRSFGAPFLAPDTPATVPQNDAFGDFDPGQIESMIKEHLRAHLRVPGTLEIATAATSTCYFDPFTKTWIIVGGYHLEIDGRPCVADPFIDAFAADYRGRRPQVPPTFDADCALLRQLPLVCFVSWPR